MIRQSLTQHTTDIGIVTDGFTRWDWQIGREGIVTWTLEPNKSQCTLSVPKLNSVSPVDVLLLLGTWPNQRSPCWGWDKLRIIILCWVRKEWTPTRTKGKVGNVPSGWKRAETSIRHKEAERCYGQDLSSYMGLLGRGLHRFRPSTCGRHHSGVSA